MATLWERAAHSVNRMLYLLCLFLAFVVSHFGFEGLTLVLIASVPGHCLLFTLSDSMHLILAGNENIHKRLDEFIFLWPKQTTGYSYLSLSV